METPMWPVVLMFLLKLGAGLREGDIVTHLPGWKGQMKSRVFAGYIPCGEDYQDGVHYKMHEHYIFLESEGNPAKDPLVIWTNGGPGAASYFGLFVELGPYYTSTESLKTPEYYATGIPTLFDNPYGWTKLANLLIINSPPPVGFSYCEPAGPAGKGDSCGKWNDTRTAKHNLIYLENWMKAFREYQEHDIFIIGESYGGVYVPTLVREIMHSDGLVKRQLRGLAVGDGCVGKEVLCDINGHGNAGPGPYYHLKFLEGHHQISTRLYETIMKECPMDQLLGYGTHVTDENCRNLIAKATKQLGGMYEYSLYDTCWYQNGLTSSNNEGGRSYWGPPTKNDVSLLGGALNDYPCGGGKALYTWIDHPEVKEILHVTPDAYMFSGDNGAGFTYELTERNLLPFYKDIVENTDLRVLIYNGDTDPTLDSFVAQNWTSHLGFKEIQGWRPWTIDGKMHMGGYVTRYAGDFDFLTIRGSGHMVPLYKPKVTFSFLRSWLKNQDYLNYDGPSAFPDPI